MRCAHGSGTLVEQRTTWSASFALPLTTRVGMVVRGRNAKSLGGGGNQLGGFLSTFEYVSVVHSIVLALGIARVLGGIADVARIWSDLKSRWFFLGWLALLLVQLIGWWFGLWARFGRMEEIGLVPFFGWFMVPASLYVASRLLIPEFPDGVPPDLDQRFDEVRRPFFACLVLSVVPALPGLPTAPAVVWLLPVYGVLALIGAIVSDRRSHIGLLGVMMATLMSFLLLARSSLGG